MVDAIPYQVNKKTLQERIAELVNDKKIEGISDIRDESDKDGMRWSSSSSAAKCPRWC